MAGRPRWWVVGLLLVTLTAVAVLWLAREDSTPPQPPPRAEARQDLAADLLDDLEAAVSARDPAAAEKLSTDDESRELLAAVVDNALELQVADFSLRYVAVDDAVTASLPRDRWAAAVEVSWRFDGFDTGRAWAETTMTFATDGDGASFVSTGGGARRTPLWLTGPVTVQRTPATLVVVQGGEPDKYTELAQRAVPVVRAVLPEWPGRLVVEVPPSAEALDRVLGADAGEYTGVAAVTTAVDGSLTAGAPVHVFINPTVFGKLKPVGAQVVMSHEATHVATDAATLSVPLWLLEGFADYVALRDVDLPLAITAGQIAAQVRKDGVPAQLPGGPEFDTRTSHLGAAYEAAWLACRVLADTGGERALVAFYKAVSAGATVDAALREHFGFGEKELTRRWQQRLEALPG